ncbi:hypothetical protein Pfo_024736 [Paulownia fortunei]|nr:hypothetical protein Pfo_024736 [Paulownia fortunei]
MASVAMAMPSAAASSKNRQQLPTSDAFFKPPHVKEVKPVKVTNSKAKLRVEASLKEKAVTEITAAAVAASMVVPEMAQAADGVTPSLNNFLLSIAAGGVVLGVIVGAVVGVSDFDPVKRS